MPPQTPLLLVDNVFDTYNLYPNATLVASSEVVGKEAFHAADYRRDRTWWQASVTGTFQYITSDLGVGATHIVDSIFVDRGHNLWGKQIQVAGDDGAGGSTVSVILTVPASGTIGGDPTTSTMAVTEEGALYSLFAAFAARRRFLVYTIDNWAPIFTGIILGARSQLLGYSNIFDEDQSERSEAGETSRAGYRGSSVVYSWRTCELGLAQIGATEYDSSIRQLRRLLFEKNQPWVLFMDYGTRPERGWMFQYDGTTWGLPKSRVLRSGRIRGREVGAVLP